MLFLPNVLAHKSSSHNDLTNWTSANLSDWTEFILYL